MPKRKSPDDKPLSIEEARAKIAKSVRELQAGNNPRAISFRLKRTKKAGDTYPLKLTQQQRESMIHCTRIKNKIKQQLKEAGEGTHVIGVTRKELDHLNDELGQASLYAPSPHKKRLQAVHRKVAELFAEDYAGVFTGIATELQNFPSDQGEQVFQFKVTLLGIKPAIWRRIQVPDCTLEFLHEYIQAAFGWQNCHLHRFEINGNYFGPVDLDDSDDQMFEEAEVHLSGLIPKTLRPSRWFYEYDFGDGWRHEIVCEGFPTADPNRTFPLCLEGARACPPEDCGGPYGYADCLDTRANPKHEQHDIMLKWLGSFDPEAFDAGKATNAMKKVK